MSDWQSKLDQVKDEQDATLERLKNTSESIERAKRDRESAAQQVLDGPIREALDKVRTALKTRGVKTREQVGVYESRHRAELSILMTDVKPYRITLYLETASSKAHVNLNVTYRIDESVFHERLPRPWTELTAEEVANALVKGYEHAANHFTSAGRWHD